MANYEPRLEQMPQESRGNTGSHARRVAAAVGLARENPGEWVAIQDYRFSTSACPAAKRLRDQPEFAGFEFTTRTVRDGDRKATRLYMRFIGKPDLKVAE